MTVSQEYFKKWNPKVNYRKHPELYHIGKGQQGVLICEPYKSEICRYWRFKTVREAQSSSQKILDMFYGFVEQGDFVGADMAKKYLHMGFTRARRYANHRDGKKYKDGKILPQEKDAMTCDKAKSATIFKTFRDMVTKDPKYQSMRADWRELENVSN